MMNKEKKHFEANKDVERFNQWADHYEQSILQRLYFGPVHAKMLKLLTVENPEISPKRILDIGCGTGRFLRIASDTWSHAELYGIDPSRKMISEATRLTPKGIFRVGFAEEIIMTDESMDISVSSLSFHHWSDQQKGLYEIVRILKPGGLFCLADHSLSIAKHFGENVKSGKEIHAMMMNVGLEVKQQRGMGWRFVRITLARK
jgi:ubiquinone/menaquinone biosynthesis C-methylase UbiE